MNNDRKGNRSENRDAKQAINSIRISLADLPKRIREQLELVHMEDNAIFHGTYAKGILEWYLIRENLVKEPTAVSYNALLLRTTDPDIVLFHTGKKNIDILESRFMDLKRKFASVGVALQPVDIDTVKGSLDSIEDVEEYLLKADLTMNQVLLIPNGDSKYLLIYTDRCKRDIMERIGILSGNGPGMYRIDCGRNIGSNAGIARLIKFLTEGKVDAIYVPDWWLLANAIESKESLGGYGLALAKKYQGKEKRDRELQKKLMKNFFDLGVTDILLSYDAYVAEQTLLYELRTGNKFVFADNRTFRQIQEEKVKKEQVREETRKNRNAARSACMHEIVEIKCEHCKEGCMIKKCTKCTYFKMPVENISDLKCNQNMKTSYFAWDQNGFFWNLNI